MGFPIIEHPIFKPSGEWNAEELKVGSVVEMTKEGIRRFTFGIDIPLVKEEAGSRWVIVGTCMVTAVLTKLEGGKKGVVRTMATAEITKVYSPDESRVVTDAFPWTSPENRIG